jgi:hypothetical protein
VEGVHDKKGKLDNLKSYLKIPSTFVNGMQYAVGYVNNSYNRDSGSGSGSGGGGGGETIVGVAENGRVKVWEVSGMDGNVVCVGECDC